MEVLQNRIDSFAKSRRVKHPTKSSTITLKWPHSSTFTANPETLAEAGFYYNPSADDTDSVSCYVCNKQLSDWEPDDDPFDIHYQKCAEKCCWATARCGLRADMDRDGRQVNFVFPDKSRLPTSKAMEKARLETFSAGDGWIHDKPKVHGANSKKMARAGFVYTPQHKGDDLATCLYCNVSLSGWDAKDDPMEEHRKRIGYQCPFFGPSHDDLVLPTKIHDGDPNEEGAGGSDSAASTKSRKSARASTAKTPARKGRSASGATSSRKPTAKTPARSRSTSRSLLRGVVEEDIDDDDDIDNNERARGQESEPPATVKKAASRSTTKGKARSRSKSVAPPSEAGTDDREGDEEISEVEAAPATLKKKPATKKKATATTTKKPTAGTARARSRSVARAAPDEQNDEDAGEDGFYTASEQETTVRKSSRSKSMAAVKEKAPANGKPKGRGKAPVLEDTEEEGEVQEEVLRKSSRRTKTQPQSKQDVGGEATETDQEAEESVQRTVKKPPARATAKKKVPATATTTAKPASKSTVKSTAKATRARTQESPVSEDEFGPVIKQPPFAPAVAGKSKGKAIAGGKAAPISRSVADDDEAAEEDGEGADDEGVVYVPLSRATTSVEEDAEAEMTPLFVPKRTKGLVQEEGKKGKGKEVEKPDKEEKSKPKAKSRTMMVVDVSSDEDEDGGKDEPKHEETTKRPEAPQEHELKLDLAAKSRSKTPKLDIKSQVKVKAKEKEKGKEKAKDNDTGRVALSKKPASSATSKNFPPQREPDKEDTTMDALGPVPPPSSLPQHEDETGEGDVHKDEDKDVLMGGDERGDYADEAPPRTPPPRVLFDFAPSSSSFGGHGKGNNHSDDAGAGDPSSSQPVPPSSSSSSSLINANPLQQGQGQPSQGQPQTQQPFLPALSKLPFTPLQELSAAELDMTVEEWIRYQMEVEFDKFKRDGERELQRFRKRAEDVRKIIEGL